MMWSEFASVDANGWDPLMQIEFTPYPPDSVEMWNRECDVVLCVRYKASAPMADIPLDVTEWSGGDTLSHRRINIPLFRNGIPAGRGNYAVYETTDSLHIHFLPPQNYSVTVGLPGGCTPPKGIVDIGLTVSVAGSTPRFFIPNPLKPRGPE